MERGAVSQIAETECFAGEIANLTCHGKYTQVK
jgi:hypothetical protein